MNLESIGWDAFKLIFAWGIVTGCYYIPKIYIQESRLKHDSPASLIDRVVAYVLTAAIVFGIAAFIGRKEGRFDFSSSYTIAVFMVLLVSSFIGLSRGYQIDDKMTKEEKLLKRVSEKIKESKSQQYE